MQVSFRFRCFAIENCYPQETNYTTIRKVVLNNSKLPNNGQLPSIITKLRKLVILLLKKIQRITYAL